MYNDLLTIGPVTLHGYGLMIAIGIISALFVSEKRAAKRGLDSDRLYSLVIWTIVIGLLGAKLLFTITYFKDFLADPAGFISGSGFTVYGGILCGIATIAIYCKVNHISFLDYIDLIIPSVAMAQGFGRIGCLLAGCCYGRETDSIIGIVFTHSDYAPNGVRLMPTQIMMSLGDFIIAAVLFSFVRAYDKKYMLKNGSDAIPSNTGGRVTLLYLIMYAFGRFIIEFFRNDYRGNIGILSTSQFIAIVVAIISAIIYFAVLPKLGKTQTADRPQED